jgi:AraC family transcriptional activator of mtrCDE
VTVLLDRLLSNLELTLRPFVVCEVASGWRLQLSRLDWVTVHFVVAGTGRLRSSTGQVMALPLHSLALVGAGQAHAIEIGDPVEHETTATQPRARGDRLDAYEAGPHGSDELLVVCGRLQARYESGQGLFDGLAEPLVLDFASTPEMASIFERMLVEERRRTSTSSMMMNVLMSEALILLFRQLCTEPECPLPWLSPLEDPRFSVPLSMMLEHPERDHTVESLATAASMSRSAFSEAFRNATGQSPMAYLRKVRLRRAAAMLDKSDDTIDHIAARSGYASRSQFSRAFSAQFGVSPSAFRSAPPAS